ncbi:MAG: hydrogenase formation protein HypD [Crenarchaeota archaeon]|nr:hydrogenase formation protein HypD [Thermoproteota archaeon]MDW8033651.1 hydrogenase formation protein HypD [Nitrososphaerota archaeon]
MRFIQEYRDGELVRRIAGKANELLEKLGREVKIMEVCGTHTMAVARHGLKSLFKKELDLISGPGCPVCVTPDSGFSMVFQAAEAGKALTVFGDMMRIPLNGRSLLTLRSEGFDVRVIYSPYDALKMAEREPEEEFVTAGIGFETTSPLFASTILQCKSRGIRNLKLISLFKLIPPALNKLLEAEDLEIDGLILPGHVSTIIGIKPYIEIVKKHGVPAVVTGFEPVDIVEGIRMLLRQLVENRCEVENEYSRTVREEGNVKAIRLMHEVFKPVDSEWRGLGLVEDSGLALREEYVLFDAIKEYGLKPVETIRPSGCLCGEVVRGSKKPFECSLYKKVCRPDNPVGPCMVSSEGTCAAYFYSDSGR